MNCEQARAVLQTGSMESEAMRHVRSCDACLGALVDRVLKTQPAVEIPSTFVQQTIGAAQPGTLFEYNRSGIGTAAALLLAVIVIAVLWSDHSVHPLPPAYLAAIAMAAALELSLVILWLGRVSRV